MESAWFTKIEDLFAASKCCLEFLRFGNHVNLLPSTIYFVFKKIIYLLFLGGNKITY